MAMEIVVVMAIIMLSLITLFCAVSFCVVRCFRPEGSRGPLWFADVNGNPQRVLGVSEKREDDKNKGWLEKVEG
mgnify:CR=1 FL=1|tara:strand:- start:635 stop:856 length:222 start_codon:yes stop_codon:yes gene_type:complete